MNSIIIVGSHASGGMRIKSQGNALANPKIAAQVPTKAALLADISLPVFPHFCRQFRFQIPANRIVANSQQNNAHRYFIRRFFYYPLGPATLTVSILDILG
jgi:hypothetical protein